MIKLTEDIIETLFKNPYNKTYIEYKNKIINSIKTPSELKYKLCECILDSKYTKYEIENLIVVHKRYELEKEKIEINNHVMTIKLMLNFKHFIKDVVTPYNCDKEKLYVDNSIMRKFKNIIIESIRKNNIYMNNIYEKETVKYCAKELALELFNKVIG